MRDFSTYLYEINRPSLKKVTNLSNPYYKRHLMDMTRNLYKINKEYGSDGKLVEGEGFLKPLNQNKYPLIRPISVFQ